MNPFRTRKKSLGDASREGSRATSSRRMSIDNEVPALQAFFKRKKTPAPEPKPELDLTVALPPSDDFRTSLLMPKLCARFSMLKEQDDPSSLLGKANDDSVLFPKRASRLDLFNTRPGLSHIAEDDPLRGPIRPPFASTRSESYGSEATDEGSIMSRSKPGEGNTMFGGRQKIYKIPVGGAGSVKTFGGQEEQEVTPGGTMAGKPIYESDTTMSTFQKLRQQEKDEETEKAGHDRSNMRSSKDQDRSGSPPFARQNRNRETSSSTTSAPSQSRASTAATSVASQRSVNMAHDNTNGSPTNMTQPTPANADRNFIKPRRLYGQALDRETPEHQPSLQRLSSFNRARTPLGANSLRQSRSATNLGDRFQRGGPLYISNGCRAGSPVPSAHSPTPLRLGEFDVGFNGESLASNMVDSGYGRSPPLSPPLSPGLNPHNPDPTLTASLEPNDIGKATASGAFNKPKRQYDEHQYLQRQLQMQEERNSPSPQFSSPFSPALSSLNDQPSAGQSRNNSQGSTFSRNNSTRRPWIEDRVPRPVLESNSFRASQRSNEEHSRPTMERSFLTSNSAISGDTSPTTGGEPESRPQSSIHPASRESLQSSSRENTITHQDTSNGSSHLGERYDDAISDSRSNRSEKTITQYHDAQSQNEIFPASVSADPPTLGPEGISDGLSGLVRAHLRSDSGQSSIYPDDILRRSRKAEAHDSIFGHGSALSNQVEGEDGGQDARSPPPLSSAARHILEQAKSLKKAESSKVNQMLGNNKAQRVLGGEAPRSSHESNTPWREQLNSNHNRGASTETQQEREELAQELAERRRIVQDKLQTFVRTESRSASPAPSARPRGDSPATTSNAFGLLKKSSRGSLVGREKSSKAMKMLGIEDDAASQPPPGQLISRDQLADHAMPPRLRNMPPPSQRPRVPKGMNEASGIGQLQMKPRGNEDQDPTIHDHSSQHARHLNGNAGADDPQNANGAQSLNHTGPSRSSRPSLDNSERSQSAGPGRLRSNSRPQQLGPPRKRTAPAGTPFMINPSTRPGPPNFSKSTPALREQQLYNAASQANLSNPRHSPNQHMIRSGQNRKQSVSKQDISDPTFISSTSSVDTIELPPGASLRNGTERPPSPAIPPPIPARDSRRKRTMTLRQAFGRSGRVDSPTLTLPSPSLSKQEDPYNERSTFSDDEPTDKQKRTLKKSNRDPTSPTNDHMPYTRHNTATSAAMF